MLWQDITMMVIGFTFAFFLILSIVGRDKPARSSAVMTTIRMAILTICVATLGLWFTFFANLTTTIAWLILAIQRRLY
jgi:fatty acid desaturase